MGLGYFLVMLVAALNTVISLGIKQLTPYGPATSAAYLFVAGILLGIVYLATGQLKPVLTGPVEMWRNVGIVALCYVALFPALVAAYARLPVGLLATMFGGTNLIFTVLAGYFLLDEKFSPAQWSAVGLVMVAMVLIQR